MTRIATAISPPYGIWRIGRSGLVAKDFQQPDRVEDRNLLGGNRFDSFSGSYGTLYFGTTLKVCFAETLARLRPNFRLKNLADEEWSAQNWMRPGNVPADWRHRRIAIRAKIDNSLPFVDIDHPATLAELSRHRDLMAGLSRYGVNEIDLGAVTGKDRRLTRYIAQYLHDMTDDQDRPQWNGIRYQSRLGEGWECWAVFDHVSFEEIERVSIEKSHPDLLEIAALYGLTIH